MGAVLQRLRQFSFLSALLRLLLAMLSGGVVGFGRSQKARAAGFRTYMLISIGAAMAVLLTQYQYAMLTGPWADVVEAVGMKFDASRLASSVITGIGFLGAGMLWGLLRRDTGVCLFFLACMLTAAGYGCATTSRKIILQQGMPFDLRLAVPRKPGDTGDTDEAGRTKEPEEKTGRQERK